jgi:O-antigen ligase
MYSTGGTTNKNALGVTVLVISLGTLWRLFIANSAMSRGSFALGSLVMIATGLPSIRRKTSSVRAVVLAIVSLGGAFMIFGGRASVAEPMGRNSDFTGRTEIWEKLPPLVPNAVIGAGFETFWLGPRLQKIWNIFPGNILNEAHNGYIEMYLNLGYVGVLLIIFVLLSGYFGAVRVFRQDSAFGCLSLSYVAAAAIYSFTEAGFRMLMPIWIFLRNAMVASSNFSVRRRKHCPLDPPIRAIMPPFQWVRALSIGSGERDGRKSLIRSANVE